MHNLVQIQVVAPVLVVQVIIPLVFGSTSAVPGDNYTNLGPGPENNLTGTQTTQNSTASATTPEFGSV